MRIAALAFGVLAGLVASLILALGGLDVPSAMAGDRNAQLIRFGLFVVANIGVFGAALVLAAPLVGAIFLAVGAVAWVLAGLLLDAANPIVLATPPALLLVGAIIGIVAHLRRPAADEEALEPLRPLTARDDHHDRDHHQSHDEPEMEAEPDDEDEPPQITIPAFVTDPHPVKVAPLSPVLAGEFAPPTRNTEPTLALAEDEEWNPRRRRPPPPRATPAFREIEVDEDEEEEESGFSRFAGGLASVMSFVLYAAVAGGALLLIWTLNTNRNSPTEVATADVPSVAAPEPSIAPSPSAERPLAPVLPSIAPEPPPATPAPLASLPAPAEDIPEDDFELALSDDPSVIPSLTNRSAGPAAQSTPDTTATLAAPPQLPAEPEPTVGLPPATATPSVGDIMPLQVPPAMALSRTAPGTGPTTVALPLSTATGL